MADNMIKAIRPPEAWAILQENPGATLIDVRTSMEFIYVGHPVDAINIPWQEPPGWEVDQDFVSKVRQAMVTKHGSESDIESLPILSICRSGVRSMAAAEELMQDGFKNVYNVEEGFEGDKDENSHRNTFNGWRYHKLPWEQS